MQITVTLPDDRSYLGALKCGDREMNVCGMSVHGAESQPRPGTYRFTKLFEVPSHDQDVYGEYILLFTSSRDSKYVLALHAGDTDAFGRLYPTEGALRVGGEDLALLVKHLEEKKTLSLVVREERLGIFGKITRPHVSKERLRRSDWSRSEGGDDNVDHFPLIMWYWLLSATLDDYVPVEPEQFSTMVDRESERVDTTAECIAADPQRGDEGGDDRRDSPSPTCAPAPREVERYEAPTPRYEREDPPSPPPPAPSPRYESSSREDYSAPSPAPEPPAPSPSSYGD